MVRIRRLWWICLLFVGVGSSRCACNDPLVCEQDAQCTAPAKCIASRCAISDASDPTEPSAEIQKDTLPSEGTDEATETVSEAKTEHTQDGAEPTTEPSPESTEEVTPEPATEKSIETIQPDSPSEPMPEPPPPVCTNGAQKPCYTGPIQTQRIGACRDGVQTCEDGQWGACANERQPQPEKCDGQDNDCDGKVDEDIPQQGQNCVTGLPGVCASGKLSCNSAKGILECLSFSKGPEICDGLDNNCDGKVDEGCP